MLKCYGFVKYALGRTILVPGVGGAWTPCITQRDMARSFEHDAADVRAVLEFANVDLLEMRYLDQQLDDALDQVYRALSRHTWHGLHLPGATRSDLRRFARLQVDHAILEGVNNALKLLGDQYLARVYRLASARFHLAEWDASILHKLEALESSYEKMSDAAANWRMEVLDRWRSIFFRLHRSLRRSGGEMRLDQLNVLSEMALL